MAALLVLIHPTAVPHYTALYYRECGSGPAICSHTVEHQFTVDQSVGRDLVLEFLLAGTACSQQDQVVWTWTADTVDCRNWQY